MEPVAGNRTPISDCPPHSTSELLLQLFQSVHRQALLRFVFSALPFELLRYESLGRDCFRSPIRVFGFLTPNNVRNNGLRRAY